MRSHLNAFLRTAGLALGGLNDGRLFAGPDELLYSYVEGGGLSSQIEGTQSSLARSAPPREQRGSRRLRRGRSGGVQLHRRAGIPRREAPGEASTQPEAHPRGAPRSRDRNSRRKQDSRRLPPVSKLDGGSTPGTAMFVPPPAHEVMSAVGALEKFMHAAGLPILIKAGLVHAQFETIHPFLDGNGRVGRMLIPLMLVAEGVLERSVALSQSALQTAPNALLRASSEGSHPRRLGGMVGVLPRRRGGGSRWGREEESDNSWTFSTTIDGRWPARVVDPIYGRAALQTNLQIYEHLRGEGGH